MRKKLLTILMACTLVLSCAVPVTAEENVTTMENCGAYLFEWRPVDEAVKYSVSMGMKPSR